MKLTEALIDKLVCFGRLSAMIGAAAVVGLGCAPARKAESKLVSSKNAMDILRTRSLRPDEALDDFNELVGQIKALYGPLKYKEARFNFKFNLLVEQSRTALVAAKSDAEIFGIYKKFLATFHDGHVSISFPANDSTILAFKIPIFLTPVAGHALVAFVSPDLGNVGISEGDELVTIDGLTPFDLLPKIAKYDSFATPESDQHNIYHVLSRPFYMTELAPVKADSTLTFKSGSGESYTRNLVWRISHVTPVIPEFVSQTHRGSNFFVEKSLDFNDMAQGSLLAMGAPSPFFMTAKAIKKYGFAKVSPNADSLAKFGWTEKNKLPEIFSALYRHKNHTVLLVRQHTYSPAADDSAENHIKYYKALLSQYEPFADVLVIDQTHNPGGSLEYADQFFRLFLDSTGNGLVQHMHADRKWIDEFKKAASEADPKLLTEESRAIWLRSELVEKAYDEGLDLTEPMALEDPAMLQPDSQYSWKKPILVLADELAGSCGDIFPMLMQRNKVAPIFGQKTMGLGGNVEQIGFLPHSQAQARLTRGMFTTYRADGAYSNADLIENNGILPDFPYSHTVEDFRGGFVGYIDAFSDKAVSLVK